MKLTIYGNNASTALRCFWAAEESNNEWELHAIDHRIGENKTPQYLAINPNGRVPAMKHGDMILWESMAINFYIAKLWSFGKLWPSNFDSQGQTYQWTMWVQREIETYLLRCLYHRDTLPEDERNEKLAKKAQDNLVTPIEVLNNHLSEHEWLIEDNDLEGFSIADLNVSSIIGWCGRAKVSLNAFPHIERWANECFKRPALVKVCNNEPRFFV